MSEVATSSFTAFGSFRVIERMNRGGTGIVYRCEDEAGTHVALKIPVSAEHAPCEALRREIATMARLNAARRHDIVRFIDSGASLGTPWYAMELIRGQSLRELLQPAPLTAPSASRERTLTATATIVAGAVAERVRSGPAVESPLQGTPASAVATAIAICNALQFVHDHGVVHGDVTPNNVILRDGSPGAPVLVDFGTAYQSFEVGTTREVARSRGAYAGTPGYMAPEQIAARHFDARADLYSLGCMLFEMAAGRRVFETSSTATLLAMHLDQEPLRASVLRSDLDPRLDALIAELLRKDPRDRPGHAAEVADRLREILDVGAAPVRSPGIRVLYRPALAGREGPLRSLVSYLERAAGEGGLAWIGGESGIGKTRLANELADLAVRRGICVLSGTCPRRDAEHAQLTGEQLALAPFASVLQRFAEHVHDAHALPQALLMAGCVLAPYAPSLLGVFARLTSPPVLPEALARRRVARSLALVHAHVAAGRPALVLVDDVQWADALTQIFLESEAEALSQAGLSFVLTHRVEQQPSWLGALRDGSRVVLTLEPLPLGSLYAMVKDMLGAHVAPEGLPEYLEARAGGNPFYAAEHLRAALAHGLVQNQGPQRWTFSVDHAHEGSLPAHSLAELIGERLRSADAASRSVLELACVLEGDFAVDELLASGLTQAQARVAVEGLVATQILRCVAAGQYRFAHDRLREATAAGLSAPRRAELHRLAAQSLERRAAVLADTALRDARLGTHWSRAGDHERALPYLQRAAPALQTMYLHGHAVALYRMALGARPHALAEAAQLYEGLADSLIALAQHDQARIALGEAVSAVAPDAALARARLHRKRAASFWTLHAYEESDAELRVAEQCLTSLDAADATARSEAIEVRLGQFERLYFARKVGPELFALIAGLKGDVAQHGNPSQRVRYALCAASAEMARARYAYSETAVQLAEAAAPAVDAAQNLHETALASFILGFSLMLGDLAQCQRARALLEDAVEYASRADDRTLLSRATAYLCFTELRLGDPVRAEAAVTRALHAAEIAKLPPYAACATACQAWVHFQRGESAQARRTAHTAIAMWRAQQHEFPFRWMATLVALAFARNDEDLTACRELIGDLLDVSQQPLPAEVAAALQSALLQSEAGDPAGAVLSIDAALAAARAERFC